MIRLATLPWLASLCCAALVATPAAAQHAASDVDASSGRPRIFVLTDIGNEPDDQMSLVRFLLYSNEFDVEGLVATTSTWQKKAVHPETIRELIGAYGEVRPSLMLHAKGWPDAQYLFSRVTAGQSEYGMAGVGEGKSTSGAESLIRAADRDDPRPLWISTWGGANTLAQALWTVRATRSAEQLARFVGKLRVYAISDQDDAGAWIRREFPAIFYVVSPSSANADDYPYATWTGIAGDQFYRNGDGADFTTVTNEWLDQNIRSKGPLGRHYLRYAYIMEGDTPAFLGLIGNGLASYRNPSWGGWAGRYVYRKPRGEDAPIWTNSGDSRDAVMGTDGRIRVSDQATVWRWREAFQHDFAARMDWSVKPFAGANHNPRLSVNGNAGTDPVTIDARVGEPVRLTAHATDPDGNTVAYRWFHYAEAGAGSGTSLAAVEIAGDTSSQAIVTATSTCRPRRPGGGLPRCGATGVAHIILAVTDSGAPSLTSYRRVILNVLAAEVVVGGQP